jgi:hypothetical protein
VTESMNIKRKDRDTVIQALKAGVVPRRGLQHFQVGRVNEVKALFGDIERIVEGGTAIRFIIGEYGSGKTFFLNLIRSIALEKKCVTVHADLSPDKRLYSTGGLARSLYAELMKNLSTRSKPEGGASANVIERFISSVLNEARNNQVAPEVLIHEKLQPLSEMVCGYDFAHVLSMYWKGFDSGNESLKSDAIRWLRGEFSTKTDARKSLGVRTIIDDENYYDMLKLFSRFLRIAGFSGIFICLDEMVNLYKLSNTKARNTNYEQILRILNDNLQGNAVGIGFLFGGTPEFLFDTRKGLYSYEALQSRLAQNPYLKSGLVDYSGPIIQLGNLTPEEIFILLTKLRDIYAYGNEDDYLIPEEAIHAFMEHCNKKIGEAYFRTPRNTITQFMHLLSTIDQNPNISWQDLIGSVEIKEESNPDLAPLEEDMEDSNDLTSFRL